MSKNRARSADDISCGSGVLGEKWVFRAAKGRDVEFEYRVPAHDRIGVTKTINNEVSFGDERQLPWHSNE